MTAKTVKIKLYKDNDRYSRDVQVIINGKVYIIKRGIEVEVPEYVAEAIENAQEQAQRAMDLIETISDGNS